MPAKKSIRASPPKELLDIYGGPLSEKMFKEIKSSHDLTLVEKPNIMTHKKIFSNSNPPMLKLKPRYASYLKKTPKNSRNAKLTCSRENPKKIGGLSRYVKNN